MRPLGGWLSDRIGGYRLLLVLLVGAAGCVGAVATLPSLALAVPLLFVAVGLLGMGNGAVFQLVPQRFAARMGIVTGIVGAAGGLGGFFLPSALGAAKDATGSYAVGLMMLSAAFMAGSIVLLELGSRWSVGWHTQAVKQSGIFCYRDRVRELLGREVA
jgi:NNP family nitrate/nitrite transporter-like MFS transporter